MESSLRNMVVTLLVITAVSSTAVGLVYNVTKEPIAKTEAAKTSNAIAEVVPEFDNDPSTEMVEKEIDGMKVKIYTARKGGELVGYAIESFSKNGFSGLIKLMVGFKPDGTIDNVAVLSHKETPGLGDKIEAAKSNFSKQFSGKNPTTFRLAVKKDGGDVDAITASTITSRAFTDGVNRAYEIFKSINKEGQNE